MLYSNKDLRRLILPLIAEQAFGIMVGMADTIMVSYAGEAAISGVSLVDMVSTLIITVLSAVATGGSVIVSQYLGHGDAENANRAASQLQKLAGLLGLILMCVGLVFHRGVLRLLFGSVEEDVMNAAIVYFMICAVSFPFVGIYQSSAALFRVTGRTRTTMRVSIMMNAINVIGNTIGIFVLHAGVAGVAVPTLVSVAVAAIVMLRKATRSGGEVQVNIREALHWEGAMCKRILNIAVPNGIENGLFMLGKVLVTSIIALFGTTQIAANGAASSVCQFTLIVVNALSMAIITVLGRCVGAEEYDQAESYLKKLMAVSYLTIAILSGVIWVLLPVIHNLFDLTPETWELAKELILVHNAMALLLHPTSFNLSNGLRAAGDVRYTMVIGVASMLIFRLSAASLMGVKFGMGIWGVWIAMGIDWLVRSIAFVIRMKSGRWRSCRAID